MDDPQYPREPLRPPMVRAICSQCGAVAKAPETMVGRRAKCPKCGSFILIPSSGPPPIPIQVVGNTAIRWSAPIIAGIAVLAALMGAALTWTFRGESPGREERPQTVGDRYREAIVAEKDAAAKYPIDNPTLEVKATWASFDGESLNVALAISNCSNVKLDFVTLDLALRTNAITGKDWTNTSDLLPGATSQTVFRVSGVFPSEVRAFEVRLRDLTATVDGKFQRETITERYSVNVDEESLLTLLRQFDPETIRKKRASIAQSAPAVAQKALIEDVENFPENFYGKYIAFDDVSVFGDVEKEEDVRGGTFLTGVTSKRKKVYSAIASDEPFFSLSDKLAQIVLAELNDDERFLNCTLYCKIEPYQRYHDAPPIPEGKVYRIDVYNYGGKVGKTLSDGP